ncbi:MAG TPA: head GIN domain-containing protein [Bacteroidales bacterium]|nr:head GIN domain-containing protein [Bacteroidales bacterium]
MKKIVFLLFCIIAFSIIQSCVIDFPDSISGNGNVVTQTRDLSEFSAIKVSSGIDVYLTQGEPQRVEVEADENLQQWIKTDVNGNELNIYSDKSIRLARTKKVKIVCKTLEKIEISSAGDITGLSRFKTDKLDIDMTSAGDLKFEVEADEVRISISSAGNADLKGNTRVFNAELSSAGDLNAYELEAKIADVSVSSAGSARVFVTDEARFRSSSAGNISYKGNPSIKEINTSSAGSVNKKD